MLERSSGRRRRWTEEKDVRLSELWPQQVSLPVIAAEFGFSPSYLSYQARRLGLPPRHKMSSTPDLDYITSEAQRRGLTVPGLRLRLIQRIIKDRLVNAVLDDEGEEAMLLGHASRAEQNAAIKVTHDNIIHLIDLYMGSGMAAMFRNQALAKLEDPQGRALMLKIVDDALSAAEKVRNAAPPPPPPAPAPSA